MLLCFVVVVLLFYCGVVFRCDLGLSVCRVVGLLFCWCVALLFCCVDVLFVLLYKCCASVLMYRCVLVLMC